MRFQLNVHESGYITSREHRDRVGIKVASTAVAGEAGEPHRWDHRIARCTPPRGRRERMASIPPGRCSTISQALKPGPIGCVQADWTGRRSTGGWEAEVPVHLPLAYPLVDGALQVPTIGPSHVEHEGRGGTTRGGPVQPHGHIRRVSS